MSNEGVELHVVRAGEGPPVVLLHGFPENWRSWRHQLGPLAEAGFCAVMPDLRGYGRSDAPRGVAAYAPERLVSDVAAIVRSTGAARAHIVGHDWGGVIAWWLAGAHPQLVDRLVIINAPHPTLMRRQLLRRPRQLLRSWYAAFFQLPKAPEVALRAFDGAALRHILRTTPARPNTFSTADIDAYVAALRQPGRLTAALNYYRAALRYGSRTPSPRTTAPTLVIWGERDVALTTGLLDDVRRYAPNARIERLPDVGHWVQNEAPGETNRLLLEAFG